MSVLAAVRATAALIGVETSTAGSSASVQPTDRLHRPPYVSVRAVVTAEYSSAEMNVGPFFFTQPNPPITHLREMQTPVL